MSDRALKDIQKVLSDLLKEIKALRGLYETDLKARGMLSNATAECADPGPDLAVEEPMDPDTLRELQELGLDISQFDPGMASTPDGNVPTNETPMETTEP